MSGLGSKAVCTELKIKQLPASLVTYIFCSPALDRELRCLPREGGYLDQMYTDMLDFQVIENRIANWQMRKRPPSKPGTGGKKLGSIRSITTRI